MSQNSENSHFGQKPRRKAEIMEPLDSLKRKVGNGGLTEEVLQKAQALIDNNDIDFVQMAEKYLLTLESRIEIAQEFLDNEDVELLIGRIISPAMQLKANGGMFHYPLVSRICDELIQFLEVIATLDKDSLKILIAFITSVKAILAGRVIGGGGKQGDELVEALQDLCRRYFYQCPHNRLLQ